MIKRKHIFKRLLLMMKHHFPRKGLNFWRKKNPNHIPSFSHHNPLSIIPSSSTHSTFRFWIGLMGIACIRPSHYCSHPIKALTKKWKGFPFRNKPSNSCRQCLLIKDYQRMPPLYLFCFMSTSRILFWISLISVELIAFSSYPSLKHSIWSKK